jgi:hypothetical protein
VQFLVLTLRNTAYTEADFAPGLPGELQRVRELYAAGFIRQIWSRSDHPGSAILVEAGTDEELEERMNTRQASSSRAWRRRIPLMAAAKPACGATWIITSRSSSIVTPTFSAAWR